MAREIGLLLTCKPGNLTLDAAHDKKMSVGMHRQ